MKTWLWLLVLPFGSLLYGAIWFHKRWIAHEEAKEHARINAAIAERGMRQVFEGHDESLRLKTQARRKAADGMRKRAAHVDSGAKTSDVLQMVKKA